MTHPINKEYICYDCVFIFSIHSKLTKRKIPFCPCCGDNVSVKKYAPNKVKREYRNWTDEELKLVERIVKEELLIYQVSAKTNRSFRSVQRRVERFREEMNNKST